VHERFAKFSSNNIQLFEDKAERRGICRTRQAAAPKVYNRVGFIKLNEIDCSAEGIEPWLEVGFDRNMVKLGYW
jgi:hypothetical protein